jgi:hypothetical protein
MKEAAGQPLGEFTPWEALTIRARNCLFNEGLVKDRVGTPDFEMLKAYDIHNFSKYIPNCGRKTEQELQKWAVAVMKEEKVK